MSSVLILTSGTRGDVDPYLALGNALRDRGDDVRLATHEAHLGLVAECGLEACVLPGNPSDLLVELAADTAAAGGAVARAAAVARYLRRARRAYRALAERAACLIRPGDVAILGLPTLWLYPVAHARGARTVACPLQPLTPSALLPSALLSGLRGLAWVPRRPGHAMGLGAISLPWWGELRRWARADLPHARFAPLGPMRQMLRRGVPFVYGFSERVVPRPADWPRRHVVGGYWLTDRDQPPEGRVRSALESFLASGRGKGRTVFVTLGSGEYLYRDIRAVVVRAILEAGGRCVIQTSGSPDPPASADVLRLTGPLPHDWILGRVDAVIHHGGAGTFGRVARAGLPSLGLRGAADGGFWARRAHEIGVSPLPLGGRPSLEELRRAVRLLTGSTRLRDGAALLGRSLRSEGGAKHAAGLIHDLLHTG